MLMQETAVGYDDAYSGEPPDHHLQIGGYGSPTPQEAQPAHLDKRQMILANETSAPQLVGAEEFILQCSVTVGRRILDHDDNARLNAFLAAGEIRLRLRSPETFQQASSSGSPHELLKNAIFLPHELSDATGANRTVLPAHDGSCPALPLAASRDSFFRTIRFEARNTTYPRLSKELLPNSSLFCSCTKMAAPGEIAPGLVKFFGDTCMHQEHEVVLCCVAETFDIHRINAIVSECGDISRIILLAQHRLAADCPRAMRSKFACTVLEHLHAGHQALQSIMQVTGQGTALRDLVLNTGVRMGEFIRPHENTRHHTLKPFVGSVRGMMICLREAGDNQELQRYFGIESLLELAGQILGSLHIMLALLSSLVSAFKSGSPDSLVKWALVLKHTVKLEEIYDTNYGKTKTLVQETDLGGS